jgi:hypothetical protein
VERQLQQIRIGSAKACTIQSGKIMKVYRSTELSTATINSAVKPLQFSAAEMFSLMDKPYRSDSSLSTVIPTQQQLVNRKIISEDNAKILEDMRNYGINQVLIDKYTANIRKLSEGYASQQQNAQRTSAVKNEILQNHLLNNLHTGQITEYHKSQDYKDEITGYNLFNETGFQNNPDYELISKKHTLKINNKFKCSNSFRDMIKRAVGAKLQSTTPKEIQTIPQQTYATIVKTHQPNTCNPVPIHNWRLSPMTTKSKQQSTTKLSKHRVQTKAKDSIITMTNDGLTTTGNATPRATDTPETMVTTDASDGIQGGNNIAHQDTSWTIVPLKNHNAIEKSLPKTFLQVPTPSLYDNDASYSYGIRIIVIPPKNKGTSAVNPQIFVSKLLSTLQFVCSNTALAALEETTSYPAISDSVKPLSFMNDEITKYIKTYTTTSPNFMCYLRVHSDHTLLDFKKHPDFALWMKKESIIFEKTILNGKQADPIGFFIKRCTTEDMLALQTQRIRQSLPKEIESKCDVTNMWVRSGTGISAKVLMLKASEDDADKIIETVDHYYNKGRGGYFFYPYEEFKRTKAETKETILHQQLEYQKNNRSLTFVGFQNFDNSVKVAEDITNGSQQKRKSTTSTTTTTNTNNNTDTDMSNLIDTMYVTDAIVMEFISDNGSSIFKRVYPPINNIMEVVVDSQNFYKVRKLSNQEFLNALGCLIPKPRHKLIFLSPNSIQDNGLHPNKIFNQQTTSKYKKMFDDIRPNTTVPMVTDRPKPRKIAKIVVYNNAADINVPDDDDTTVIHHNTNKSTNSDKTTSSTKDNNPPVHESAAVNNMMSTITTDFQNSITDIKSCISKDTITITQIMQKMEKMEQEIQTYKVLNATIDDRINSNVQSTVRDELKTHLQNFELDLNNKLAKSLQEIDSKNEDRVATLVREHQLLREECSNNNSTTKNQFDQIMEMLRTSRVTVNPGETSVGTENYDHSTKSRGLNTRSTRHSTNTVQHNQQSTTFDSGAIRSCLNKLHTNYNE